MELAVDVFKVTKVVANPILYIFLLRSIDYNFRFRIVLFVNYANTVILDKYLFASNVWIMVPPKLKNKNYVEIFQSENRKWELRQCKCKLCLPYIQ